MQLEIVLTSFDSDDIMLGEKKVDRLPHILTKKEADYIKAEMRRNNGGFAKRKSLKARKNGKRASIRFHNGCLVIS